jgi:hypothetical protein
VTHTREQQKWCRCSCGLDRCVHDTISWSSTTNFIHVTSLHISLEDFKHSIQVHSMQSLSVYLAPGNSEVANDRPAVPRLFTPMQTASPMARACPTLPPNSATSFNRFSRKDLQSEFRATQLNATQVKARMVQPYVSKGLKMTRRGERTTCPGSPPSGPTP